MTGCSAMYSSTLLALRLRCGSSAPGTARQRQQEQQHQRGAHRGQRAPGVADQREQRNADGTRAFGRSASARADEAAHIGSRTSLTNASRTQETKSFHTPVTSAMPDQISSDAAEDLDGPGVPAQPAQPATRPAGAECQQHERNSQAQAVGDDQQHAARHARAVRGRRDGDHAGQRRAQARRPAQREHRAQQWRAASRWSAARREAGLALQRGDRSRRTPAP